jgi:hypothetical protein
MKKTACVLLYIITLFNGYSQQPTIKVNRYTPDTGNPADKQVTITMPYAGYSIVSIEGDTAGLFNAGEIIIDVVCTDYPSTASLEELNKNRLAVFYELFPFIDRTAVKTVNFWRQLIGDTKENAQLLFHGLVIRYRLRQTPEMMKEDISSLEKLLENKEPVNIDSAETKIESMTKEKIDSIPFLTRSMHGESHVRDTLEYIQYEGAISGIHKNFKRRDRAFKNADSMVIMTPSDAFKKGIISKESFKVFSEHAFMTVYFRKVSLSSSYSYTEPAFVPIDSIGYSYKSLPDSTLFKIFSRNKWKNISITGDVTGSMYPFTAQLLLWIKLQSLDSLTHHFTFFNDGDNKRDDQKHLGSTGGIYSKNCKSFDEVKELVTSTMQKGSGGDAPENNIEALLAAEKQFPEISFHVMIADNWAPVKDKELVKKLSKPVRIVLCGVNGWKVNVDYLNLARQTGGSLHLMEEDLLDLAKIHEGQTISIGNTHYRLVNGEFVEILSM